MKRFTLVLAMLLVMVGLTSAKQITGTGNQLNITTQKNPFTNVVGKELVGSDIVSDWIPFVSTGKSVYTTSKKVYRFFVRGWR